jgi:pSer/pThr/pTyr-binding forkhead associated (FHA) protein
MSVEPRQVYARLVSVDRHGNPGKAFCLCERICLIGRNTDHCDIRIYRPEVSSVHTKITVDQNNSLWVENLSKTNPTFLNGKHVDNPTPLHDQDIVTVGTKSFLIQTSTYINNASLKT